MEEYNFERQKGEFRETNYEKKIRRCRTSPRSKCINMCKTGNDWRRSCICRGNCQLYNCRISQQSLYCACCGLRLLVS